MALSILNVAYPLAPVHRDTVGGAEQIVAALDEAIAHAGHHPYLLAREDSQAARTLVPVPRLPAPYDEVGRARIAGYVRAAIAGAIARWPIDVVHLHGVDFLDYLPPAGVPVLVTLHLPPSFYPPSAFFVDRADTRFNAVSRSQQAQLPPGLSLIPAIGNGVDVDALTPTASRGSEIVALGRICEEKGFHLAVQAARRAGLPLRLAGELHPYPEHQRYFREVLSPLLDEQRRFIGPVGFADKRSLLARARAVVVPSLVPETSSLVAMEAQACGAPVVAMRIGALPEVVEDGVTGFLVEDLDGMVAALADIDRIDGTACRARAVRLHARTRMTAEYLNVYRWLAGKARDRT